MNGVSPVGGAARQGTDPPAPAVAGQGGHILLVQFEDLEVLSNAFRRHRLGHHGQGPLHGDSDQHLGCGFTGLACNRFDPRVLRCGGVLGLGPSGERRGLWQSPQRLWSRSTGSTS